VGGSGGYPPDGEGKGSALRLYCGKEQTDEARLAAGTLPGRVRRMQAAG